MWCIMGETPFTKTHYCLAVFDKREEALEYLKQATLDLPTQNDVYSAKSVLKNYLKGWVARYHVGPVYNPPIDFE